MIFSWIFQWVRVVSALYRVAESTAREVWSGVWFFFCFLSLSLRRTEKRERERESRDSVCDESIGREIDRERDREGAIRCKRNLDRFPRRPQLSGWVIAPARPWSRTLARLSSASAKSRSSTSLTWVSSFFFGTRPTARSPRDTGVDDRDFAETAILKLFTNSRANVSHALPIRRRAPSACERSRWRCRKSVIGRQRWRINGATKLDWRIEPRNREISTQKTCPVVRTSSNSKVRLGIPSREVTGACSAPTIFYTNISYKVDWVIYGVSLINAGMRLNNEF